MRITLLLLAVVAAGVVTWLSVFTVDPTEFVYVTQFGRHVATYDGNPTKDDAGLHFRWPWPVQNIRRLDRRLQHFDLPAIELLTRDSHGGAASSVDKTLTVEAYVCWRIADKDLLADKDPVDLFVRRIDTTERARAILGQRVNDQLGALIGNMRMDDLISIDTLARAADKNGSEIAGTMTKVDDSLNKLRRDLLANLKDKVLNEYGIDIVDVRLKRFNHPVKVRDTIFNRIISERKLKAAEYENEGQRRAADIRAIADAKVKLLTKAAEKLEKEIKLEAEAEAELIRVAAFKQDKEFFDFWQQLEQMKSLLGNPKTTLLLSTHRSVFDFLFHAPGVDGRPAVPRPDATPKKGD